MQQRTRADLTTKSAHKLVIYQTAQDGHKVDKCYALEKAVKKIKTIKAKIHEVSEESENDCN